MLFNICISDMQGELKCTLTEFAGDTSLSGEMDISKGRASLQEVLGGLEDKGHISINH